MERTASVRRPVMFHVGDKVKDTIYTRSGVVVSVVPASASPDVLVEWTHGMASQIGQRDWCFSGTEITKIEA
jgi:heat shock protein HspQ